MPHPFHHRFKIIGNQIENLARRARSAASMKRKFKRERIEAARGENAFYPRKACVVTQFAVPPVNQNHRRPSLPITPRSPETPRRHRRVPRMPRYRRKRESRFRLKRELRRGNRWREKIRPRQQSASPFRLPRLFPPRPHARGRRRDANAIQGLLEKGDQSSRRTIDWEQAPRKFLIRQTPLWAHFTFCRLQEIPRKWVGQASRLSRWASRPAREL